MQAALAYFIYQNIKPRCERITLLIPLPNENSAKNLASGDSQSLPELKWLMENTEDIVILSN